MKKYLRAFNQFLLIFFLSLFISCSNNSEEIKNVYSEFLLKMEKKEFAGVREIVTENSNVATIIGIEVANNLAEQMKESERFSAISGGSPSTSVAMPSLYYDFSNMDGHLIAEEPKIEGSVAVMNVKNKRTGQSVPVQFKKEKGKWKVDFYENQMGLFK